MFPITDISDQFLFKTSSVQLLGEKLLFSGLDYVSVPSFRPIAAASKNPHLLGQKDRQKDRKKDRRKDKFTEFIAPPRFFRPENLELPIGSEVNKTVDAARSQKNLEVRHLT